MGRCQLSRRVPSSTGSPCPLSCHLPLPEAGPSLFPLLLSTILLLALPNAVGEPLSLLLSTLSSFRTKNQSVKHIHTRARDQRTGSCTGFRAFPYPLPFLASPFCLLVGRNGQKCVQCPAPGQEHSCSICITFFPPVLSQALGKNRRNKSNTY